MTINNRKMTVPFFTSSYPWLIVCCGMLFYCYNYFLRVSPSVMQTELTETFHITATQLGTLAGLYYWAYTPVQLPAGMLYDKFGVRFVLCLACLIAVIGLSVFISADTYFIAGIGRMMIGFGCAFAYIGTLKLASIWLPSNRFGSVAGLTTAIGMLAGALTQKYLIKIVSLIGYQEALRDALVAGVVLSIILAIFVRNQPLDRLDRVREMEAPIDLRQLWLALRIIIVNKQMWLIGIIGCLLYLPASVFLDLWGIPYLQTVHHLNAKEAVSVVNFTAYGWIISGPVIGYFSDKIKRRRLPLTTTGFFAALLLAIVFYGPTISHSQLYGIFFMIGFCCGAHPLCFALGKENNPIQISGTAIAVTNMLIMAGGGIFEPVVGRLLDFHKTGMMGPDGLPIYSASDYTFALSVIPIGVALGIFLSIFLKETYCESQAKEEEEQLFRTHTAEPEVVKQASA